MKIIILPILILLSLNLFADECPKFSSKKYKCTVTEEGESYIEEGVFDIRKSDGNKILYFSTDGNLAEVVLDNKRRKTSGLDYQAWCAAGVITISLNEYDFQVIVKGDRRNASVISYLNGKISSSVICSR